MFDNDLKLDKHIEFLREAHKARAFVKKVYPEATTSVGGRDIVGIHPNKQDAWANKNLLSTGWDEEEAWIKAAEKLKKWNKE